MVIEFPTKNTQQEPILPDWFFNLLVWPLLIGINIARFALVMLIVTSVDFVLRLITKFREEGERRERLKRAIRMLDNQDGRGESGQTLAHYAIVIAFLLLILIVVFVTVSWGTEPTGVPSQR
jgi:hypothetical protein